MVTVAILGLGARGGNVYSNSLLQLRERCRVTAICDINKEKVQKIKEAWQLDESQCFCDEDEFLKEKRADGIIIATDDKSHFKSAMRALDLGYEILIEKPISSDPLECLKIAEKSKKVSRHVIVAHVLRYAPFFVTVKEIVASGAIGDIVNISQTENVGYWHYTHSFVRGNWNNDKTSSPMILAKCCHDLDIINYLIEKKCLYLFSVGSLKHFNREHKPQSAPKRCTDGCSHEKQCPYYAVRVYIEQKTKNNNGWMSQYVSVRQDDDSILEGLKNGPYGICVYDCDNNVVDHQSVLMQYEDGITATLTMNAFSKDCFRELSVSGTKGEVYGNDRDNIITINVWNGETQVIDINKEYPNLTGHGGGDMILTKRFLDLLYGDESQVEDIDKIISSHINAVAAEKSRLGGGIKVMIKDFMDELLSLDYIEGNY